MMHLHLKTCPAAAVSKGPCPTHYHGCDQARKLLAHYRQCKSARLTSRHTGGGSLAASRRSGSFDLQPAAHCLICSFVARQARTLLVGGTGSPPGGGASSSIGSLASTSWNSRKHPPPSKGSHTVSFVVDVVADAVSALARDDAPPAKTITSPASAKTGSPPGNGILKLAPPPVQVLLPPPPPPPPPPSPYDQAATGPSGQEQANRAGSDDDADEDVVMSTVDNDSTRPQLSETVASTKAVLVPDSKTPTSSPPDPTFLSEPDAASLLCSLACNLQLPLKVLPESYSMMHPQQRRDRAVSSADSLVSSTVPAYHHPLSIRRDPLTLDAPPQPLGLVRRRSVSLGSAPQSYGPRATAAASLRVDDTIYEEGSQTSGDSIEPLDFPNF